ncbi:DUF429 domain-containing protein [Halogranum rubrum]|uniref:DUF429 domain-containing protein n=1 Tax=Halogranum salarium B-1 TaxID=1210908 RepID=J3A7I1_9EURY|nr:DUF429 domain-containing protein [Halogranum salarium]EJN61573.1 hypothetical protein HSB1_06140 [Halogranum salarium B-1]
MTYIGADGCPGGWLAVEYSDAGYERAEFYEDLKELYDDNDDATRILIDVPIGLREKDNTPRKCDAEARKKLGSPRSSSVFPTPIREALDAESYEEAKQKQEEHTDGSLNSQTWGIIPKIREVDEFLLDNKELVEERRIREAHPEVCFWAFHGKSMEFSKTKQSGSAFWERMAVLQSVADDDVFDDLADAGEQCMGREASIDDYVDAFVLALTARSDECELETLPEDVEEDPEGLPMEMVFTRS